MEEQVVEELWTYLSAAELRHLLDQKLNEMENWMRGKRMNVDYFRYTDKATAFKSMHKDIWLLSPGDQGVLFSKVEELKQIKAQIASFN